MFKRVDIRDGSVSESPDTRVAERSKNDFERQHAGNIERMLEDMTHRKDQALLFLDRPFTKTTWMMNVLEENLSLRESDSDKDVLEIIERTLEHNEFNFQGLFYRLNAAGYSKKIFAKSLLGIIIEVRSERERIRNSINETI